MAEKSDLYEFKMDLFDRGDPKEFLLFIHNFQMTLEASGMLADNANIQYIRTLLCGKALRHLDMMSVEVGSTTTTHLNLIILVLYTYFFPINMLSKVKCAMPNRMRKPRKLKA